MILNTTVKWRLLNGVAATMAVFIGVVLLALNILGGLILVTLGPFTLERVIDLQRLKAIFMQAERLRPFLFPGALAFAFVTGVLVCVWSQRTRLESSAARRQSLFWLSTMVGVALVAFSYRLLGLLAVPLALWVQLKTLGGRGSARQVRVAWALAVVVSVLPVDFSLQFVDAPPHFAPAVSGLFSGSAEQYARRGEYVMVGGCVAWYYEPRWVWVW